MDRLSKIHFNCKTCDHKKTFDYDEIQSYHQNEKLNLKNINALISEIYCGYCYTNGRGKVKDFAVSDINDDILFDTRVAVICDSCNFMIPIPRTKTNPEITTCIACIESEEGKKDSGRVFPKLPVGVPRDCPSCDGLVKVYWNNFDKNYFLGCSNYKGPVRGTCRWTSGEFFNDLN